MFRSNLEIASAWVESFNKIFIPRDMNIALRAVMAEDGFDLILSHISKNLREDVQIIPCRVNNFSPSNSDKLSIEYNRELSEYVAKTKSDQAKNVNKGFTLFWDDDVTVNGPIPVINLIKAIESDDKCENAIGVYPDRRDKSKSYVKLSPYGSSMQIKDIKFGDIFKVATGSPGFSLWNTEYLKSILPIIVMQGTLDTFIYTGLKLEQDGRKCLCHGGVRMNHDA